jgi:hypothetical protein
LTLFPTLQALCVILLASPGARGVAPAPWSSGGAGVRGEGDGGTAGEDRRPPLDDPVPGPGLTLSRGPGQLPLHIPLGEELEFDVILNVAVLGDAKVGEVVLSAGVEPFVAGLPAAGDALDTDLKVGWIKSQAKGSYITYDLDHQIEMRALPQAWPRVIYRDTQEGTENRKRELKLGDHDGTSYSEYRSDTHCKGCERREHFVEGTWPFGSDHHCDKCKRASHRVWREATSREVPEGTLDMLSAIYYSRTMVRAGLQEISVPLLDKTKLWELTLSRGKQKSIRTPAGKFLCREIQLATSVPASEESDGASFEGLFGIHGTIHIWLEEQTGVPVSVQGLVPIGPIELDVQLSLRKYHGTPADFAPLDHQTK